MGIVLKRRDNAPIVKYVFGNVIEIIMIEKDFQKAFLYSTLVVVTVKNAPWSALPEIFISLNINFHFC